MAKQHKRMWEKGDEQWKMMIAIDAKKAEENQRNPDEQCCFGKLGDLGRCKEKSVMAATFYGFTTGFSLCAFHGRFRDEAYPHGTIKIKPQQTRMGFIGLRRRGTSRFRIPTFAP